MPPIPNWGFPEASNDASNGFKPKRTWIYDTSHKRVTEMVGTNANENTTGDTVRRQNSFKRLLAGIAVDTFGYDLRKGRNESGKIVAALHRANLPMDQGTVKSLVEQALNEIEYDFTQLDERA